MPGERVTLAGDIGGRIRAFVAALGRFPDEPPWVVVGGFAVNVRISQVHRLTNDIDTISSQQAELVEILLAQTGSERLDHAKLRFTGTDPAVDIDVMDDTAGQRLPAERSDRAFALARRYAMDTREQLAMAVIDDNSVTVETLSPVATVAALVALKAVSMPRRADGNHPEKAISDAHDLVRLVEGRDLDELARTLATTESELARWIGDTLVQWFSAHADQRYTMMRLRRLSSAVDAQTIDEDALGVVALLGQAVLDGMR